MTDKKQTVNRSTLHTVLLIVFSLLCALLIWVYVTETNAPDTNRTFYNVKVMFDGESVMRDSRGLVISDLYTTTVKVELTGNRRVVSGLKATDLSAVIDLNGISKTGNYSLSPKITYASRVDSSLVSSAVTAPGTISFYVDKLSVRTVPVMGVFNGSAAEGFIAEPLEFDTDTIRIYGPEKVLAGADHALIEVSRTEVDKSLTFESTYVLQTEEGERFESDDITFDRDTVIVTLPVSAVKDVDLVVDLIPGGGATRDDVRITVEPDHVTLIGDSETLAGVNTISLAKIDLSKLDGSLTETYKIVIPNDTHSTGGVKEAQVTLEIVGLERKEVSIAKSNISIINNSPGFVSEVMNSSLDDVVIRGSADVLRGISEVNVRAVVDLKDYGTATGFVSLPVRIVIDGTSGAGAVGEYEVYVNITEDTDHND